MYIDPIIMQWAIIGGASFCAYMIGKLWADRSKDQLIEDTISYLVENKFLRSEIRDGEETLVPYDEKNS